MQQKQSQKTHISCCCLKAKSRKRLKVNTPSPTQGKSCKETRAMIPNTNLTWLRQPPTHTHTLTPVWARFIPSYKKNPLSLHQRGMCLLNNCVSRQRGTTTYSTKFPGSPGEIKGLVLQQDDFIIYKNKISLSQNHHRFLLWVSSAAAFSF